MKKLLWIIPFVICSCTPSRYHLVVKSMDNDSIVIDTVIVSEERLTFKGKDAKARVEQTLMEVNENEYLSTYQVSVDYVKIRTPYTYPIEICKFKFIK